MKRISEDELSPWICEKTGWMVDDFPDCLCAENDKELSDLRRALEEIIDETKSEDCINCAYICMLAKQALNRKAGE